MKKWLKICLMICLIAVLGLCGFGWWFIADDYHADDTAAAAMRPAEGIAVKQEGNTVAFIPDGAKTGLIFYPGAKVEHTAYAPLMRQLADRGILCVLVEMPLKLAILNMNAADGIPQQYPQIDNWYIGGHSLGGSMAASYAAGHAAALDGLVLLASYATTDLSAADLRVISIYGSEDGVLNMSNYTANRGFLPAAFQEAVIEGGCHAGFGSYGPQAGDGTAAITGDAQVRQTVALLVDFFAGAEP